jgi:Flp pilus assembly protein CpaB
MASIVAQMSPERMNRWLLIGAAAFAVLAGALVFALLANVGSDDGGGGGGAAAAGDRVSVLVATETISPGTIVTADMLELASFEQRYIVPDKVDDVSSIIGSRAAVRVLQGQQISRLQFIGEGGTDVPGITPEIPPGHFAYAVSITEVSGVAGLIVPGDRVDIVVRYSTRAVRKMSTGQQWSATGQATPARGCDLKTWIRTRARRRSRSRCGPIRCWESTRSKCSRTARLASHSGALAMRKRRCLRKESRSKFRTGKRRTTLSTKAREAESRATWQRYRQHWSSMQTCRRASRRGKW